ncbi:hypothetical protein B296_00011222 [Ensete ventricosum]|uniref:Uncharacterized protein n=1 Tax=Ensete ventricosum TaxID=4639 RepID=A0A427AK87_ENSVE|nr:hypothetical protein B296_00011222 [Ensete ventricosum]
MNPPSYMWLYNVLQDNKPSDGKLILRILAKETQGLAERAMITRLIYMANGLRNVIMQKRINKFRMKTYS